MTVKPSVEPLAPYAVATSPPDRRRGWTAGRVFSIAAGSIVCLLSLTLLSFAGLATWETNTDRDAAGYLTASSHTVTTGGYAITSNEVGELAGQVWGGALGTVRIRATASDPAAGVFIGVAPKAAVDSYLTGVDRTVVTGWFPFGTRQLPATGAAPKTTPIDSKIWTAQVSGQGTRTLTWRPASDTTVVVMDPNAGAGVRVTADVAASVPDLAWFAVALFVLGGLLLGAAVVLIAAPMTRIRKEIRSS